VAGRRYWLPGAPRADAQPAPAPAPSGSPTTARIYGRSSASGAPATLAAARPVGATVGTVVSPMQGRVLLVHARVGQVVEADHVVCVLEAMKMEQEIVTRSAGTVREVRVAPGDSVAAGDPLVVVEP
jgi:biotin carboxyl carrier protein